MLSMTDVKVAFRQDGQGWLLANRGVNIDVPAGIIAAIIGESGSGKSVLLKAALNVLPAGGGCVHSSKSHRLLGEDVASMKKGRLMRHRKSAMLYVPQESMALLDPLLTAEEHIKSRGRLALEAMTGLNPRAVRRKTEELCQELVKTGLVFTRSPDDPSRRIHWAPAASYSGGMRQLTFLAQIMIANPRLVVIDEGTTALDKIYERVFFTTLADRVWRKLSGGHEPGSVVFVSHDIDLARRYAHRVFVMYAGLIVESGPVKRVIADGGPRHPYTALLLNGCSCFGAGGKPRNANASTSPGIPNDAAYTHGSCPLCASCDRASDECRSKMPEETWEKTPDGSRMFRCHHPFHGEMVPDRQPPVEISVAGEKLLELMPLNVTLGGLKIVHNARLDVREGESVGIVGGSGQGKSTLVKALLKLPGYKPDRRSSRVEFEGRCLDEIPDTQFRQRVQYVAQIVHESFPESFKVWHTVLEPLFAQKAGFPPTSDPFGPVLASALADVGLDCTIGNQPLRVCSGGEKQRVGIARALVALGIYGQSKEHAPRLLILDEPTSSLDAVIKTHILDLLMKLRSQYRPAYLVISHDLDMIRRLCGRINVLYRGMVVEQVPCSLLSKQGSVLHPYTEALCKGNYEMTRQVPDFGSERTGCPCWGWCAIKTGACLAKVPELRNVGNGHLRACCADEQVTPPKGP